MIIGATHILGAVLAILLTAIVFMVVALTSRQKNARLPPGTMGWLPIVGETLEYARPNCSLTAGPFLNQRIQRYGNLFKSHLFGEPIIVSTDAKVNQFILQKEGSLFRSSYPRSLLGILGKQNTTEIHGEAHKAVRNAVLNVVGARTRSEKILSFISTQILKKLETWEGRVVQFQEEAARLSFCLVINQLLSIRAEQPEADYLFRNFEILTDGLLRVPIDLPGTPYRGSMKARTNVTKMIEKIISEKLSRPAREISDVLDGILAAEESNGSSVTRDIVIDVMVGVIFAAYETTSSVLTFVTKFITEHPQVLDALQREHNGILTRIAPQGGNYTLTWEDYKSMSFTENVVKETLRLANAGDLVFRQVMKDVEINGFTIPKGWKMMLCFIPPHMDAEKFPDPLAFNPWRWDQDEIGSGDFMPFGGGPRQCAGKDLAKLEVTIFIHHLVTRCRWAQVEQDEVIRSRGARFKNGLPLYFTKCKCS